MQHSPSSPYPSLLYLGIISVTLFSHASIYVPRLDLGSNTNAKLADKRRAQGRSSERLCL